jgi:hypothetical protein
MSKPKNKKPSPIHLGDFGCIEEIKALDYITATFQMNRLEVAKFLRGLEKYCLRRKRIPDVKLLGAIDVLKKKFDDDLSTYDVCFTGDAVIATYGVRLEPIDVPMNKLGKLNKRVRRGRKAQGNE